MATNDLSDDYVADLLKQDAKKHSKDYSLLGASAYMPQRPRHNAPRTNLRFLNNLIKDTDNHNKALLAKEAQESRARLRSLGMKREKTERSSDDRPSKRRRVEYEEDDSRERRDDDRERKLYRSRRDRNDSDNDERRSRRDRREGRMRAFSDDRYGRDNQRSSERRRRRSRSRSRSRSRHRRHGTRSRSRDMTRRHRHRSSSADPLKKSEGRQRSSERKTARSPSPARKQSTADSDSDPLEAIVGPLPRKPGPIVRPRGRGAFAAGTSLDAHFDSKYDPSMDVSLEEDRDDWEDAVEAMKDRLMWQKKGAERLRAAGFTEEEVQRWEKGGQKNEEDVRWKKRGEGREWDRGKVVDTDGDVMVKPEWGRLKGT